MSAMFAFEVGEVTMRSLTFEDVMSELMMGFSDPTDRGVVQDALDLNCLWVDQIELSQKGKMLRSLCDVLDSRLESGKYADDETALIEINALKSQLIERYPTILPAT